MADQSVRGAVRSSGLRVKRVSAAGRTAGLGLRSLMPHRGQGDPPADGPRLAGPDGGAPVLDGGAPVLDRGAPRPDDGAPVADGAAPRSDGGAPAAAPLPSPVDGWQLAFLSAPRARRVEFLALMQESVDGQLQPARTTRWLAAWRDGDMLAWPAAGAIGRSLRREGRVTALLDLYAALPAPADPAALTTIQVTHAVAREVLLLPEPAPSVLSRAADEVEWLLDQAVFLPGDAGWTREAVLHTLALARLREGRLATAELLCQPLLAVEGLAGAQRATALATVVLARRALGLPYQAELDEALALAPDADLVAAAAKDSAPAESEPADRP